MDANDYQAACATTAQYPDRGGLLGLSYVIHGLTGEAGEVAEKFKKILRDKGGQLTDEDRLAIAKELGDAQWYLAECATQIQMTLGEIMEMNVNKLASRKERGKISGSGDDR